MSCHCCVLSVKVAIFENSDRTSASVQTSTWSQFICECIQSIDRWIDHRFQAVCTKWQWCTIVFTHIHNMTYLHCAGVWHHVWNTARANLKMLIDLPTDRLNQFAHSFIAILYNQVQSWTVAVFSKLINRNKLSAG